MAVWTPMDMIQMLRQPKVDTDQQRLERCFPLGERVPQSVAIDRVMKEFPNARDDMAWASGLLKTFLITKAITGIQDAEGGPVYYKRTEENVNLDAPPKDPEFRPQHTIVPEHELPVMVTIVDPDSGERVQVPHPGGKTRHIDAVAYHANGEVCTDRRCHGNHGADSAPVFPMPRP